MKLLIGLFSILFIGNIHAKTIARVLDIQGNAFLFSSEEKAKELSYGEKITDLSEVMVEDGSTLSLVNTQGHVIHVNGGSLVKFYNGITELKNGYVWVNVKNSTSRGQLNTTNSIANYSSGQFIYSFDNQTGKTQLLVLTGDVSLSNALEPSLKVDVAAGNFTLVEQKYNNGLPRSPTKIGLSSYKSLKNVFANFKNLDESYIDEMIGEKKTKSRAIASVDDQFSSKKIKKVSNKRGKLIVIKTYGTNSRLPASASPMEYYSDIKKAQLKAKQPVKTGKSASVRYYGFEPKISSKINTKELKRVPASVGSKSRLINELSAPSEFERSLMEKSSQNKRHSDEVNNLIDDLKSYSQDFKKNY